MYRNKRVKITTLNDKTLNGAIEYVTTGNVSAKCVMFQIGSNDIGALDQETMIENFEQLVKDKEKDSGRENNIWSVITPFL